MSEKILIPLDGSEIGEAALRYVEEMISNLEAGGRVEVNLLQVLAPPSRRIETGGDSIQAPMTEEEMTPIKQEALAYLEKSGEGLRSRGADVKCKMVLGRTGTSSAEEIIKAEDEFNVDLVAMSTHGRRGISRWAFGSVTDKVLRGGKVPVLVVRAKKRG
ncbi:MAG: universal stress protein [Deltaproteobacteria bacterium]|nr:universal stress protein [Deltaproteobacteria bacterium]